MVEGVPGLGFSHVAGVEGLGMQAVGVQGLGVQGFWGVKGLGLLGHPGTQPSRHQSI